MQHATEPGEYQALIAKAQRGNKNEIIQLLQFMRTHKVVQPELTLLQGARLLKSGQSSLGSDQWTVLEQVFYAAAALNAENWRDYCLRQLRAKFPSSIRVKRLQGVQLESKGEWSEAKKIYQQILEEKPEDTTTHKRLIAMLKQSGKLPEAIEEINKYLETFSTDSEVWHELGELYIETGLLQRAVFCFEELMVSNPRSMYHILTYAELLYSTGDMDLSRKYFSLACYLDGKCLRALWGLAAVNMALAKKDEGQGQARMVKLQQFTVDRLRKAYKATGGKTGKAAMAVLDTAIPKTADS